MRFTSTLIHDIQAIALLLPSSSQKAIQNHFYSGKYSLLKISSGVKGHCSGKISGVKPVF